MARLPGAAAVAGAALGPPALLMVVANAAIVVTARSRLYSSPSQVPRRDVGLVLGTSPTLDSGAANPYFWDRVDAAERLYRCGRVAHLLLSGDPDVVAMRSALTERGIPPADMTVDRAGHRTLESVRRADAVYGLDAFTVVTQRFHASRAVAVALARDLDAVACCTPHPARGARVRVETREVFARTRAFVEIAAARNGAPQTG